MSEIVTVREVTKDYPLGETTVKALRGATLEVYRGDFIALVGPQVLGRPPC
jgi:putative ABC transport system ATP-binding protein